MQADRPNCIKGGVRGRIDVKGREKRKGGGTPKRAGPGRSHRTCLCMTTESVSGAPQYCSVPAGGSQFTLWGIQASSTGKRTCWRVIDVSTTSWTLFSRRSTVRVPVTEYVVYPVLRQHGRLTSGHEHFFLHPRKKSCPRKETSRIAGN